MNDEDHAGEALIAASRAGLSRSSSSTLVARARTDLRKRELADEWLRKGIQLLEGAKDDPHLNAPVHPYADIPSDHRDGFQRSVEYIRRILGGDIAEATAETLGMSHEEQEVAHVAYFFFPEALAGAVRKPSLDPDIESQPVEKETRAQPAAGVLISPRVPPPKGMADGILSQSTMERLARQLHQLQQIEREDLERQNLVEKRNAMLAEALSCFEKGYELDPANPELLHRLAYCYRHGIGGAVDEPMAISMYQRAATFDHAGDAFAQVSFTCLPENGRKPRPD